MVAADTTLIVGIKHIRRASVQHSGMDYTSPDENKTEIPRAPRAM
jgi:hypothetical protein